MMFRSEAGHERIVVRKRLWRKRWDQTLRPDATRCESLQIRDLRALDVVPPPPVERDEYDDSWPVLDRGRSHERQRQDDEDGEQTTDDCPLPRRRAWILPAVNGPGVNGAVTARAATGEVRSRRPRTLAA